MKRGLWAVASAAVLVPLLMTGMYWILDILPIFAFAALIVAYAALSQRQPRERPRLPPSAGGRPR